MVVTSSVSMSARDEWWSNACSPQACEKMQRIERDAHTQLVMQ
jgi:hypothetical protein